MSKWGELCDDYNHGHGEDQFGDGDQDADIDGGDPNDLDEACTLAAPGMESAVLSNAYMINGPPPAEGQGAPKDALSILSVNVPTTERQSDISGKAVVWYQIHIRSGTHLWQVTKRYRDCNSFHDDLKGVGLTIDQFPGKSFLSNNDDGFILKRKQGLDNYFRAFLNVIQAMTEQGRKAPALASKAAAGFALWMDFVKSSSRSNLSTVKNPAHRAMLLKTGSNTHNKEANGKVRSLKPGVVSGVYPSNAEGDGQGGRTTTAFGGGDNTGRNIGGGVPRQGGDTSVRGLNSSPGGRLSGGSYHSPGVNSQASTTAVEPRSRVLLQPRHRFIIMLYLPGVPMNEVYIAANERDSTSVLVGGSWTDPGHLLDLISRSESAQRPTSARSGSTSAMVDALLMDTAPIGDFEMVFDIPSQFARNDWVSDFSNGILYIVWEYKLPSAVQPLSARSHGGGSARGRTRSARGRSSRTSSAAPTSSGGRGDSGRKTSQSAKTPTRNVMPPAEDDGGEQGDILPLGEKNSNQNTPPKQISRRGSDASD